MSNNENVLLYFDYVSELYELYEKVKQAVILAENFNKERKMYIAPLNQMRCALDHIFKSIKLVDDVAQFEYEVKEAKEHLNRAGYDAFELLSSDIGITIVEKLNKYKTKTITAVFPEYYSMVKPELTNIKISVGILRSDKNIDSKKTFSDYFDQIQKLIEIDKKVDLMIPSLEEYDRKNKREKLKTWVVGLVSTIVSGLTVGVVVSCF